MISPGHIQAGALALDAMRPVFAAFVAVQALVALEIHGLCPQHVLVVPHLAVGSDADGLVQQLQQFESFTVPHVFANSFSCSMMLS